MIQRVVVRDRVDAGGEALLRTTAGVPPRGFEPLISTLKGWRPRPLDDGGEGRSSLPEGPAGLRQRAGAGLTRPIRTLPAGDRWAGRTLPAVPLGNTFRMDPSGCIAQTVKNGRLGIGPRGVHHESVPGANIGASLGRARALGRATGPGRQGPLRGTSLGARSRGLRQEQQDHRARDEPGADDECDATANGH